MTDNSNDPLAQAIANALNGGSGSGQQPVKVQPGQTLIDSNGQLVTVTGFNQDGSVNVSGGLNSGSSFSDTQSPTNTHLLTSGSYQIPGQNKVVSLTADGTVSFSSVPDKPQPADIRPAVDANGKAIPGFVMADGKLMTYDQFQKSYGGGSGGGTGHLVGEVAPDPAGAINAMLNYYKVQVAQGQMPRDQAQQDFDNYTKIIEQQTTAAYDQNSLAITGAHNQNIDQSNFDQNQITKANNEDTSLRMRAEDETQRAQNIQNTRTAREQDLSNNILPKSLPGVGALNIPLFGNMNLNQIQPDTYTDVQGMNAIPHIPTGLQSQAPNPTAPMQIPTPNIPQVDPSMYPQLPQYTPPPVPNQIGGQGIDSIIQQILSGNSGHLVNY